MKKSVLISFLSMVFLSTLQIETLDSQESKVKKSLILLASPPQNSSFATIEIYGKADLPKNKPVDLPPMQGLNDVEYRKAAGITKEAFDTTGNFMRNVDYNLKFEKNVKDAADLFMKGAAIMVPSITGKLGLAAASAYFDRQFEEYVALQKYEAQKSAIIILSGFLEHMRDTGKIHRSPSELTGKEKADLFMQVKNSIHGSGVLKNVGNDVFPVMAKFLFEDAYLTIVEVDAASRKRDTDIVERIEGLKALMTQSEARLVDRYEQNTRSFDTRVQTLEGEIENLAGLSKSFILFQQETNKRLEDLTRAGQKMYEGLKKLDSRVTDNERRIASLEINSAEAQVLIKQNQENIRFMQQYLYSNMSARDQLKALDQGWFPKDMEKNLREKAELLKAREDFSRAMNGVAEVASMGTFLAAKWGANPKVLEKIDFAISAFETGLTMWQDVISDAVNPLNWAKAIFTLGFGSAGARRHKQVMKALKSIAEGQQKIMEGLQIALEGIQAVTENQKRIMDNQRIIIENQIALSNQISAFAEYTSRRFDDINEKISGMQQKLEQIHDDILYNRVLTNLLVHSDLNQCQIFLDGMSRQRGAPQNVPDYEFASFQNGLLWDYDDIRRHYDYFRDSAQRCFTSLSGFLGQGNINSVFSMRSSQTFSSNEIESFYKTYGSFVKVFRVIRDGEKFDHNLMTALLVNPSLSTDEMEFKYHLLMRDVVHKGEVTLNTFQMKNRSGEAIVNDSDLDDLLNPILIKKVAEWVLRLHHYYQMSSNPGTGSPIYTRDEYSRLSNVNFRGRDILGAVLKLINVAIIQQALLSGDYLLDEISRNSRNLPNMRLDGCLSASALDRIENEYAKGDYSKYFSNKTRSINPVTRNPRLQRVFRWKQEFFDNRGAKLLTFTGISDQQYCDIFKSKHFSENYFNYLLSNKYVNGLFFAQEVLELLDRNISKDPYCDNPFFKATDSAGRYYYKEIFNCGEMPVFVPSCDRLGAPLYNPIIYDLAFLKKKVIEALGEYKIVDLMKADVNTAKVMAYYLLTM